MKRASEGTLFGLLVRVLVVAAALAIVFVTPAWAEASNAVVPISWPESASGRSLILTGAFVDALAVMAIAGAVVWPRLNAPLARALRR